jgi:hypothetical protein
MRRDAIHTDSRGNPSAIVRARAGILLPAGGKD